MRKENYCIHRSVTFVIKVAVNNFALNNSCVINFQMQIFVEIYFICLIYMRNLFTYLEATSSFQCSISLIQVSSTKSEMTTRANTSARPQVEGFFQQGPKFPSKFFQKPRCIIQYKKKKK